MEIQNNYQKPNKSKLWIVSTIWANIIIVTIILVLALGFLKFLIAKLFGLSGILFTEGWFWQTLVLIFSIFSFIYAIRLGVKSVIKESTILQEDIKKISIGVAMVAIVLQLISAFFILAYLKINISFYVYVDFIGINIGYFVLTYFWFQKLTQYQKIEKAIKYLAVLAIVALVVGGILAWQKVQTFNLKLSSELKLDETANWKTYTNEKYGFQFKYPADTDIFSESDKPVEMGVLLVPPNSSSTNVTVYELKQEAGQRPYNEPLFKVEVVTENISAIDWFNKNYSTWSFEPLKEISFKDRKSFEAKGKKAIGSTGLELASYYKILIIEEENFLIVITQSQQTKFLDDIFNTFILINREEISTNKDETANWKTYRNDEYGFEFKYPKDWTTGYIYKDDVLGRWSVKIISQKWQGFLEDVKAGKTYCEGVCGDIEIYYQREIGYNTLEEYITKNQEGIEILSQIEFAGQKGYEIKDLGISQWYSILITKDNHLYEISFDHEEKSSTTEIERQILSTFKFLK
jgi:hypothetical protein